MVASLNCQRAPVFSSTQCQRVRQSARRQRAVLCRAAQVLPVEKQVEGMLALAPVTNALASEFDILGEPVPTSTYIIDDASVLNKITKSEINKKLKTLEITTGYRVEVVTVRKLEIETDAFAYADKVLENWYPTAEEGDKKAVLLVVTASKDGALTGGPGFVQAIGDELVDSIVSDNIPILTEAERYNETVSSSVERIDAKLNDRTVPDAPRRNDTTRVRTYKTKEETEKTKSITGVIVGTLLVIAFIVPMLQYYGYTAKD